MKNRWPAFCSLNVLFLSLVFLFSVFYTYLSLALPFGTARMPGASFLPRIVGVMAIVLSAGLLIVDVRKAIRGEAETKEKLAYPARFWWFVASFVVYVLIFRPLGYVVSTILFTFVLCMVMKNKLWVSALIAVLTGIAFFIIFSLLSVPLPMGVLTGLKLW